MRKLKRGSNPQLNNLIMGFAEQIALIGIMWAILYANTSATIRLLTGLGFTLPYFPFALSVFVIVFLVGFYVNIIRALQENLSKKKRTFRK
jgi:uncharacterized membrane protein (DUF106 family)